MSAPLPSKPPQDLKNMDQLLLKMQNDLLFTREGEPSEDGLKKALLHFKDRFRLIKRERAWTPLLDSKRREWVDHRGGGIELSATWHGDGDPRGMDPSRMITPTMSRMGFRLYKMTGRKLPTFEDLQQEVQPQVGLTVTNGQDAEGRPTFTITAAMVYHHPHDEHVTPLEEIIFPTEDVLLGDGCLLSFHDQALFLRIHHPNFVLGKGRLKSDVYGAHRSEDAAKAKMLWEAAQSKNATYHSMKSLANRLFPLYDDWVYKRNQRELENQQAAVNMCIDIIKRAPMFVVFPREEFVPMKDGSYMSNVHFGVRGEWAMSAAIFWELHEQPAPSKGAGRVLIIDRRVNHPAPTVERVLGPLPADFHLAGEGAARQLYLWMEPVFEDALTSFLENIVRNPGA
jgi:hypothetical protein